MKINLNNHDKIVKKKDLGIYIHIPFCEKKCDYCDFLSAPATNEVKKSYIDAVIKEIACYKDIAEEYQVRTIFIGGGTPSCIEETYIDQILRKVYEIFVIDLRQISSLGIEITIEVNPGTITLNKLKTYQDIGINRLSFGLQSTNNEELKLLGRIHTYEEFEDNYRLARKLGFHNINIDLMSSLPNQTMNKWLETLQTVIRLEPEHISAYSLIIEEGTPFYVKYNKEDSLLPTEEVDRQMYEMTKKILSDHGYHRYEISNYAKPGYESKHNSSYWRRIEYLGIGLGAASYINHQRFYNETNLTQYIKNSYDYLKIRKEIQSLNQTKEMEEFMFLGLRMSNGISKEEFLVNFDTSIESVYADVILRLEKEGLLINESDRIYLTDRGIDISNYCLSEFLLEDS